MKRISLIAWILVLLIFISCTKEFSLENGGSNTGSAVIVGTDCRISKIDFYDSSTNIALGSIAAAINAKDTVTDVTLFDSLTNTLVFNSMPTYSGDTIFIDPDEYFIVDNTTKMVSHLHGVLISAFPTIPFEADYVYNPDGTLAQKKYDIPGAGVSPAVVVDYTYIAGNLTHVTTTDYTAPSPEVIKDADVDYYSNIKPKNYLNLMPDETINDDINHFAPYTQFFNFGKKPVNAIKKLIVRNYFGGVATDSTVSNFATYILSRDNYVVSVYMLGDDQESIPAAESKLVFSYKCK